MSPLMSCDQINSLKTTGKISAKIARKSSSKPEFKFTWIDFLVILRGSTRIFKLSSTGIDYKQKIFHKQL